MAARTWLAVTAVVMAVGVVRSGASTRLCPAVATVAVFAQNLSADATVEVSLEGELLRPAATCDGPGDTTYGASLTCSGSGLVPCGQVSGLRPGAWVNRLRVRVSGSEAQVQAQRALFVGGGAGQTSNVLIWTVYPRTYVVTEASAANVRAALDAANPGPALVIFDRSVFPDSDHPREISFTSPVCDPETRRNCSVLRLTGSRIAVDALDPRGAPGGVVLSAGVQRALVRVLGSDNVLRGLVLQGSRDPTPTCAGRCQFDSLALSNPAARGNRVEQSVIRGPALGDGLSSDGGAGEPGDDGTGLNVVDRCELSGAGDRGLKVTTGARLEIRASCLHDNANGGVLSTDGGRVVAIDNVVQHNVPSTSQNGLSVLGKPGGPSERSTLTTNGNIVRFSGNRGLSVVDNAEAVFTNDYVSDNQFAGSRVDSNLAGVVPQATFHGVALTCNHNVGITGVCWPALGSEDTTCVTDMDCCGPGKGCCAGDPGCAAPASCVPAPKVPDGVGAVVAANCAGCSVPLVNYGDDLVAGANAFSLNPSFFVGTAGINFNLGLVPNLTSTITISARGNQWQHCGAGATCSTASVLAQDVRISGRAHVDLGTPLPGPAAGKPTLTAVSTDRPAADEVVRIFGSGFDAIDGAACGTGNGVGAGCAVDNSQLAARNHCPGRGNCIELLIGTDTIPLDVVAVTPTMLAFRMPFDCYAPAVLRVSRLGADGAQVQDQIALCDPSGCRGQPATTPCDDGDPCTRGDHCQGDVPVCVAGTPVSCQGPCLSGTCNFQRGCTPSSASAFCDDGNPCTVGDHCSGDGACVPGTTPAPVSVSCDDGDPCTVGDHCSGDGACVPGTVPAPVSASCDAGDPCTVGDHCSGDGACLRGSARSCDDGNACTADACDPGTGCLHTAVTCDDGDPCTSDECDHVHGCLSTALDCNDDDACTADTCNPERGCVNAPVACDDGDPCTADTCDPATGCTHTPVTCDDGDPCTVDGCAPGQGCFATPRSCHDGDPCTHDECAADGTCTYPPLTGYEAITCRTTALQEDVVGTAGGGQRIAHLLAGAAQDTTDAQLAAGKGDAPRGRRLLGRAAQRVRRVLVALPRLRVAAAQKRTLRILARAALKAIRAQRMALVTAHEREATVL
jgi:hypothetical protein